MLNIKLGGIKYYFLKALVWLDLGLNPGLPDHCRKLYSFSLTDDAFFCDDEYFQSGKS